MSKERDFRVKLRLETITVDGEEIKVIVGRVRRRVDGRFIRFGVTTKKDLAKAIVNALWETSEF
jgi:hypothetical protein